MSKDWQESILLQLVQQNRQIDSLPSNVLFQLYPSMEAIQFRDYHLHQFREFLQCFIDARDRKMGA